MIDQCRNKRFQTLPKDYRITLFGPLLNNAPCPVPCLLPTVSLLTTKTDK